MKITEIKTGEVWGHGYSCFVRIHTDSGIVGTGECTHGGAGIQGIIAPLRSILLGDDPMNVDRLFEKRRRGRVFDGAASGNFVTAITGITAAAASLMSMSVTILYLHMT